MVGSVLNKSDVIIMTHKLSKIFLALNQNKPNNDDKSRDYHEKMILSLQ